MGKIVQSPSIDAWRKRLAGATDGDLLAHNIMLEAQIDALQFLLTHGVTERHVVSMLANLRECAGIVRHAAESRGVDLFLGPDRKRTRH